MAKLITETTHNIKTEKENSNGDLYIYGIFSSAERPTENGRKYKKEILDREVQKLLEHVKAGSAIGELNHPPQPDINPERAAIKIESLEWKDGYDLLGKAKVLSRTPMGQTVRGLIEDGVKIGISSRGTGEVNEDGYVADSYNLITFDLVGRPASQTSWVNGVYEGQEFPNPYEDQSKKTSVLITNPTRVSRELEKEIKEYKKKIR